MQTHQNLCKNLKCKNARRQGADINYTDPVGDYDRHGMRIFATMFGWATNTLPWYDESYKMRVFTCMYIHVKM